MGNIIAATDLSELVTKQNKRISELEAAVLELTALLNHYKEQFRLSQRKRFGTSSEQNADGVSQLNLLNYDAPAEQQTEGENTPATTESAAAETITYTRRKKGKRRDDLSQLPLEIIHHEIPVMERMCPKCGYALIEIGIEKHDDIKIAPAQVIHVEHHVHVYKCNNCDKTTGTTTIVKAEMPAPVIKGSVASASAIAYIVTQKYTMHLPLYRMEQDFKRQGVAITRQNMANWVIQVCSLWLCAIYNLMIKKLLTHQVIHSDDTSVQVLREAGKAPQSKSKMWLYRTGGDSGTPVVIYEYQPGRHAEYPENFLKGWAGYLHADGYAGYHSLKNVVVVGCWAHARRKFFDAWKVTKLDGTAAKIGLDFCDRLFELELEFANMTAEERFKARLKKSKPVADALYAWAETVFPQDKTLLKAAIGYLGNQKEWLMNVYLDGRLELSNNRGERSIKPFVMGRKNWLFSNSEDGAKASAMLFSIIETAKENGLNPFEYIKFLLETLPNTSSGHIEDLLPWNDTLPAECRA